MTTFEQTQYMADECLRCGLCVEQCDYLQSFVGLPGDKADEYLEGTYAQEADVPFRCSMCSLCAQVCPLDLDTGVMMAEIRHAIRQENIPLPGYVSMLDQNHRFTISDEYAYLKEAPSGTTKRLFFPGCNLVTYSPELVVETYRFLREQDPDCGILLGCCASPYYDSGDRETYEKAIADIRRRMEEVGATELVLACSNCHVHMSSIAGIPAISLYDVLADTWPDDKKNLEDLGELVLHDPCKARFIPQIRNSVRRLLAKVGCSYREPEQNDVDTHCCGQGGMVAYTDYNWTLKMGKQRAQELNGTMVTYCATCRSALREWDTPGLHVLDLLFTDDPQAAAQCLPHDDATVLANRTRIHQMLKDL